VHNIVTGIAIKCSLKGIFIMPLTTSNLDFTEWGTLFTSPGTAVALLDHLLHHSHVVTMRGDSYRIRNRLVPPGTTIGGNAIT
jgi:hypothetical protein